MKPAEYAQELGISRQAVYAKIKRGILTAKNVEGKLYIVVDKDEEKNITQTTSTSKKTLPEKLNTHTKVSVKSEDYKALLRAKDETISVLKGTVKDLKKSNKQISTTLKGEIDLLKEAFHEMRSLYVMQLEQKVQTNNELIDVSEDVLEDEPIFIHWIGMKQFFKSYAVKEKKQEKIKKRLRKAYKNNDNRVSKIDGKLKMDQNAKYEDILK